MSPPSRIFKGHRVLGFVSNHVPLTVRYIQRRKENLVVTVVGKSFHTYGCSKLRLLSISNPHPEDINCLTSDAYLIFTACHNTIRAWRRGIELKHTYVGHNESVHLMVPLGPYLLSVDASNILKVWNIKTEETFLELSFDPGSFYITAVVHPSTYLNKILLGSKQGRLQLWNISTSKLIHTFAGWNSEVTVLEQAPAIDVVAVGLATGGIIIHNLKYDETVMKFHQDWGPITALSFRLDGQPILTSASTVGHIAVWDLDKKKLCSQIRDAHQGSVTGMRFLPNEPLLVTSSPDNSLKVWIFDQPDGSGRILRLREGHSAPPSRIRFYGRDGQNIISSGQDSSLRSFSTTLDLLNKSLGQASYNRKAAKRKGVRNDPLKMPPIVEFAHDPCRECEWDNIAACHRGVNFVSTWSYKCCKMGTHKLRHERFKKDLTCRRAVATCVAISICGNFVVVGLDSGHVDMYNIQSGIFRGQYGEPKAHEMAVLGVATDNLNQLTVTAGCDAIVKFWRFKSKELLDAMSMDSAVTQLLLHRESGLLAAVLDDFSIQLIDIETRKIVRFFLGHSSRITDVTFSPDSRWLISCAMDCTIRTWDAPTGHLVDCFLVDAACTSLSMSPTGDYLCTAHVDDFGIYLWSNCTLYSLVTLRPLPEDYEPVLMELPNTTTEMNEASEEMVPSFDDWEFKSPAQISEELVTLSLLPHSHWHNLLMLDVIKQRNKPKDPPKAPKSAPFFLPTVPGLEFKFSLSTDSKSEKMESHVLQFGNIPLLSPFGKRLDAAKSIDEYVAAINMLKEMGSSAVDIEIRSLSPNSGGTSHLMQQFVTAMQQHLDTNLDFEVTQAYLALFLKLHWDEISLDEETLAKTKIVASTQKQSWERIQKEFNICMGLVNFFKHAAL